MNHEVELEVSSLVSPAQRARIFTAFDRLTEGQLLNCY